MRYSHSGAIWRRWLALEMDAHARYLETGTPNCQARRVARQPVGPRGVTRSRTARYARMATPDSNPKPSLLWQHACVSAPLGVLGANSTLTSSVAQVTAASSPLEAKR